MEKERILENVVNYLSQKDQPQEFIKGETEIPVSGGKLSYFDILNLVDASIDGWITEGKWSEKFRRELVNFTGFNHAVLCNSGSSANLLAINAVKECRDISYSGYVLTSALAFPTTVAPIVQAGFTPLFVDIDIANLNPSVHIIQRAIEKVKPIGIVLAHTLGFPYNAEAIDILCKKNNMFFVQDMCDCLGASTIDGKSLSGFGDVATLSFFPAHQITTGEGGAVLCNDGRLFSIIRSLSNWGRDCWCKPGEENTCNKRFCWNFPKLPAGYDHKYVFSRLGYNMKMTDLQAALGFSQMGRIKEIVRKRRINYNFLYAGLTNLPNFFSYFTTFYCSPNASPFGFPLMTYNDKISRSQIVDFLESRKIKTRPIFSGNIVRQPMMEHVGYEQIGQLEACDMVMEKAFWVGCHPELSIEQLEYVIESFGDFIKGL